MNKYYLSLLLVVILANTLFAQSEIISAFNSTHSGRSITFVGTKTYNSRNEFGIGIRFNINKLAHNDDQNNVFKKRQYATAFIQHWGIETFYHRYILQKWECIHPFLFYDLQLSYSQTRNRMFLPNYYHEDIGYLYEEIIDFFGPYTWVEQCIGVGMKVKLIDGFYLYEKIGFGTTFILGKDESQFITYDKFNWEFAGLLQVGIIYRFKQ